MLHSSVAIDCRRVLQIVGMYYRYAVGLRNLGPNTCICRNCMHQFRCFAGVGVAAGDRMRVSPINCGQPTDLDVFPDLAQVFDVQDGPHGSHISLGILPINATFPNTYNLCWCPGTEACDSAPMFRAPGGELQALGGTRILGDVGSCADRVVP